MPRPRPITDEQGKEIVRLYGKGISRNELARRYKASPPFIIKYLRENGARIRSIAEACRAKLPEAGNPFLDATTNPSAAYWIGFLMGDGCISEPRGKRRSHAIIVVLQARDSGHLAKLSQFMGTGRFFMYTSTAKSNSGRQYARLHCHQEEMAQSLIGYGVTPRKSKTARVCDELSMNVDFWRGVIDADGCLRYRKRGEHMGPILALCGSEALMNQFAKFAKANTNSLATVYQSQKVWNVSLNGQKNVVKLVRLMYGHGGPSLDRKQLIADDMIARTWRKMGFGRKSTEET